MRNVVQPYLLPSFWSGQPYSAVPCIERIVTVQLVLDTSFRERYIIVPTDMSPSSRTRIRVQLWRVCCAFINLDENTCPMRISNSSGKGRHEQVEFVEFPSIHWYSFTGVSFARNPRRALLALLSGFQEPIGCSLQSTIMKCNCSRGQENP